MRKVGRILKTILGSLTSLILVVVLVYCVCMWIFPQQVTNLVGFRFYTIVTGSMEPTIPTGSMVLVKSLAPGEDPQVGGIVTFKATRLGDPIVLTHYLREIQVEDDGQVRYITRGENTDHDDDYVTHREDLLGTYVFHMPFLGRLGQFLRSTQALFMYLMIGVILLIYYVLSLRLDRRAQRLAAGQAPEEAAPQGMPAQGAPATADTPPAQEAPPAADTPSLPEPDAGAPAAIAVAPTPKIADPDAATPEPDAVPGPHMPEFPPSAAADASASIPLPPSAPSGSPTLELALRPGDPPALAIEARTLTRQAGRVVLRATARNISAAPLRYVKLTVRYLDSQERELAAAEVYLAAELSPGEAKPWQSHVPDDPAIRHERITVSCK